jgi:hypothetical protein
MGHARREPYRGTQQLRPTWEWFKPNLEELAHVFPRGTKAFDIAREHVERDGLICRPYLEQLVTPAAVEPVLLEAAAIEESHLDVENVFMFARTDFDAAVCVGQLRDGRWVGFLNTVLPGETKPYRLVLPEINEDFHLGVATRELAVRMTCAIVLDPERRFGVIEEWLIDESQRASPEEFRCAECQRVLCEGHFEEAAGEEEL